MSSDSKSSCPRTWQQHHHSLGGLRKQLLLQKSWERPSFPNQPHFAGDKDGGNPRFPPHHSLSPSGYYLSTVMDAGEKHAGGLILPRWSTCQCRQSLREAAQLGYLWPFKVKKRAACVAEKPSHGKTSHSPHCTQHLLPSPWGK